jgi:D-alanyl-D-alanine carboxypeptidase (penicillin-binding protein 5/6)
VNLGPEADPLPEVWAATWLLADAETGEVLAHKGAHVQRAPASTLKTLTALTVLPQTSPDQTYVATRRATDIYGSKVGLKPGKTYTMHQLWNAVFLPSANDAAIAVAEVNGGVRTTVKQMNEVAAALGAFDTVAKNTNGLDAPGQVSSAYDLALIARAGLARDDFASYARTARAPFPNLRGKGSHTIYTTNRMLLNGWPGAIGVKTGFTSQAGRTFVGAAERKGRTLIVSLMGIKESTEGAATKLLSWGFRNADRVEPVGVLVAPTDTDLAVSSRTVPVSQDAPVDGVSEDSPSPKATAAGDLETQESSSASLLPAGAMGLIIAAALAGGVLLVRRGTSRSGRHVD